MLIRVSQFQVLKRESIAYYIQLFLFLAALIRNKPTCPMYTVPIRQKLLAETKF
jgi:hypothetical protein